MAFLTPEELASFDTEAKKRRQLEMQLAQAEALRARRSGGSAHWAPALGYAGADIINALSANAKESSARKGMEESNRRTADARAQAIRSFGEAPPEYQEFQTPAPAMQSDSPSFEGWQQQLPQWGAGAQQPPGTGTVMAHPDEQAMNAWNMQAQQHDAGQVKTLQEYQRKRSLMGPQMMASGDRLVSQLGSHMVQESRQQQQQSAAEKLAQWKAQQQMAEEGRKRAAEMEDWKAKNAIEAPQKDARARLMGGIQAANQRASREAEATRGTVVPGLEVVPGAAPTADDAKKVKASMASRERMQRQVQELRELYSGKDGTPGVGTEFVGPSATRMKQLMTGIKLEGKTLAELGALSGPDEALMDSVAGADPTSLVENLKAFIPFRGDTIPTAMDGVEKWATSQTESNQKAYGYQPKGGGVPKAQAAQAGGSGGKKVAVDPKTGERLSVDSPEEEASFRQNGWVIQ